MRFLFSLVPKNHLSFLVGMLVRIRLPKPFSTWSVKIFAKCFGIDASSASKSIEDFRSIGEFFVRDLKPGLRPIGNGVVSPVDGFLRGAGEIVGGELPQIKDRRYCVVDLLRDGEAAARFEKGTFFNFYLAPPDYHHIHAPVAGLVTRSVYIPGKLWPVNDWSLRNVDGLFTVNERMAVYLDSDYGRCVVVMVGATNVGGIELAFESVRANGLSRVMRLGTPEAEVRGYSQPLLVNKGDRLGTFSMGSSVVLLFENDLSALGVSADLSGRKVLFGESL